MREKPDFDKMNGLVPAVVQDAGTGRVLMVGYMNEDALRQTEESGRVTFFSRSRNELWEKGETSGHVLRLESISLDCDQDAILVRARPQGPTCHTGEQSCFSRSSPTFVDQLETLIAERRRSRPAGSYTTRLFEEGRGRIAQKVGEEALETALAAVQQDRGAILSESADLLYHLLVLLADCDLEISDVVTELETRHSDQS